MGGRERIAGIPAHGGQDHICRPAVAGEGRRGVSREVAAARVATVPLATTLVITVSLRGKPLAEGAMHHGDRVYHEHQLISQTRKFRTSDELASDRATRRLPALPYDELPR